jgi:hypothetical protein
MDAYIDYLRQANEARLSELRREADQYRLVRSLRSTEKSGRSWFALSARLRARAARRVAARPVPKPVRLPRPMPAADEDMQRIA